MNFLAPGTRLNMKLILSFIVAGVLAFQSADAFDTKKRIKKPTAKSMQELDLVIKVRPTPDAYCQRADVFLISGEAEEAIKDFSSALKLRPMFPRALLGRSKAYEMVGDNANSLKDAEAAMKVCQGEALADAILQKIRVYRILNRLADLPPLYEKLIKSTDLNVHIFSRSNLLQERAEVYLKLKQPEKALTDLDASNADGRVRTSRCYLAGQAYTMLGNRKKAIEAYSRGIESGKVVIAQERRFEKTHMKCYQERAQLYENMGQLGKARSDRQEAERIESEYIDLAPFRLK